MVEGTPMDADELTFEPGSYLDTWLVRWRGQPVGAVGYAEGDGRWRAAWQGQVIGSSYATREDAARMLVARRQNSAGNA